MRRSPLVKLLWLEAVQADSEITPIVLAVAVAIAGQINADSGQAWGSMARFASTTRLSAKSIQRAIKTLRDRKLLSVIPRTGQSNVYEILFPDQIPQSVQARLDTLVRRSGLGHASTPDSPDRLISKKQDNQRPIADQRGARAHGLERWLWGCRPRLLGSDSQVKYEPVLREQLEKYSIDFEDLAAAVKEHLLQRVKEGSLTSSDLLKAQAIGSSGRPA